jgi:cell wall-associated NlpC family hydrolase
MNRAVCCVPVSPLRADPSHKSEIVSQQLFGECCEVLEQGKEPWVRIRCSYDDYEGWCTVSHLAEIAATGYEQRSSALAPEWVNELDYKGIPMMVPFGSSLGTVTGGASWGNAKVRYNGPAPWDPSAAKKDAEAIRQLTAKFLNTPYLWGGRSVFGIDCSGFTQTVYKFLGVPLLRDAYQQATQGSSVGFLQEAMTGDLAFFDNDEGRITHVGILLNDQEIIHSSGKVRIDKIDNMGIVNSETFQRTHQLRVIKRCLPPDA